MQRRSFLQKTAAAAALAWAGPPAPVRAAGFPDVRTPEALRKFRSAAVERAVATVRASAANKEIAWLFGNCFPNTLDTTVEFEMRDGRPDTYVITGDIDAMWLRDSTAQVFPYLAFAKDDPPLQQLIAGVIHRQVRCIRKDPYANAFYKDDTRTGEWKHDLTDMKPGLHERKWEVDSLCYPVRLAYHYWKATGDTAPFDAQWAGAVALTVGTFREQQRKTGRGPYKFERTTSWATDGVPLGGYGYPAKPVGLIHSMFRPSDDATVYPLFIPANFFASVSLRQAAEMLVRIRKDAALAADCRKLADEVDEALRRHATVTHPAFGKVYAYEVNGYGSHNLMDDANVPSLLSLPYLGAVNPADPVYRNTRRLLLSPENPFFFKGAAGEGIGGPHVGVDMVWHLSIIMRGLTATTDAEIRTCVEMLRKTHGGTGFMHEAFHKDDAARFTRKWFAWANTLFGEFIWKTYRERRHLLA